MSLRGVPRYFNRVNSTQFPRRGTVAKLKAVVAKLDDVDEKFRSLYVERDGKFHLDAEGVEDVEGLRGNRDEILKEKKKLEKKLAEFGELTPEEAKQLKDFRESEAERKAKEAGEFEKLKTQLVEKHTKELEKRDGAIAKRDKALDRYIRRAAALQAIGENEGTDLLLPHVLERLKLVEKDDEYVVVVTTEAGDAMVDTKGVAVPPKDFVASLKTIDKYKGGFKGTGASGSGAENRPNAASGAAVVGKGDLVGFGQNLEGIAKGTTVVQ